MANQPLISISEKNCTDASWRSTGWLYGRLVLIDSPWPSRYPKLVRYLLFGHSVVGIRDETRLTNWTPVKRLAWRVPRPPSCHSSKESGYGNLLAAARHAPMPVRYAHPVQRALRCAIKDARALEAKPCLFVVPKGSDAAQRSSNKGNRVELPLTKMVSESQPR